MKRLVELLEPVEVPPLADLLPDVAEGQVVSREQAHVARQAVGLVSTSRVSPASWRGAIQTPAETVPKPSQASRDRSACRRARSCSGTLNTASSQPSAALGRGRWKIRRSPSARISLPPAGQAVAGRARRAPRLKQAAQLEPGDRRAHRGLVDAKLGHQPDEGGDAEPASRRRARTDRRSSRSALAAGPRARQCRQRCWLRQMGSPSEPSAVKARQRTGCPLSLRRFIDYRHGNAILGPSWWRPEEGPDMQLSPSAHADTFCRDNLPPG